MPSYGFLVGLASKADKVLKFWNEKILRKKHNNFKF